MPTVVVRGVSHHYEWIRHQQANSKPVMVFVHGWGGSARYWRSTAEALADDFDCLLYDLRGFGRSSLPPEPVLGYDMEDYAADLAALLDALGLERVYINAHSMGASIATLFLNRYGDRVQAAILTCNGIFEYDAKAFAAFHKFGGYVVKFRYNWFLKFPFADQMFMARFLHRPINKSDRLAFLEDFLLADYDAAAGTIYTSVSQKAVEIMPQEFAQISVPTLMVSGEKDIIIPAKMGKQAAALNDNIKYVELPKTSHFPMLEDPAAYLKTVREFLQPHNNLSLTTNN
ncbi:alpha/beta fold hydrolase [Pleurocapsa sp. FMAR1]|uniref:alpha/beta fold hydrolase n=1 Tax=Pleurocapsa sp. FMAR1 TaxID=3040204 RepID=UPI0029C7CAC9|nr:alpha/beta hydrolase [Pleurocapsa sp. FMAR1]